MARLPPPQRYGAAGIDAPDMGDVAKLFGAPRDLLFVESILLKERFDARDEFV
jgi:hypothetical protein